MTTSDKLREIARKHFPIDKDVKNNTIYNQIQQSKQDSLLSDLTALISEDYVEKAKYDEAVRQRDELREALEHLVHLHGCEQEGLLSGQPTPEQWYEAVELAEAAIKSTER